MGYVRVCFDVIPVRYEVCRNFFFGLFILFLPKPKTSIKKKPYCRVCVEWKSTFEEFEPVDTGFIIHKITLSFCVTSLAQAIKR